MPRTSKANNKSQSPDSRDHTATPQPKPASSLPDGGALPLLQLELLHNYNMKTYRTLCADPCLWEFWRDDVVQLGFSCDYIMRALLAVSALHLAFHRPERRDFYIEEGILLHQQASRSAMLVVKAGTKIDKQQAASFFLFSMLTIFFGMFPTFYPLRLSSVPTNTPSARIPPSLQPRWHFLHR